MSDLSHRKATQRIRFTDENGQAAADQDVRVKLVNHKFLFGSGANDFIPPEEMTEEERASCPIPAERFDVINGISHKWLDLFNFGTMHFYWGTYEHVEGQTNFENHMRTAKYFQKHGVKLKGHPLCWHTVCADWLMNYDNATILSKQLDRINRDVSAFKGVIDVWDVINEVVIMQVYDRYDNAVTRICKDLGRIKLCKEVFDAAKAANPDATLLINDFNLSESYRILIDGLLNAGVPVSAIGIQTHQHQGYMGKEKLEDILERFSFFGLPLHFTENTLISGELMPPEIVDLNDYQPDEWPTTPEGEERQRKEWKEMYELLFAHPKVEAITGWDFVDGAWLGAPAGLIRKDGTAKPAYDELKRLVKEEWTTDYTVHTDSEGYAEVTGFKGEYEAAFKNADGSEGSSKFTLE
ncbi:MAG: endo-1,4-beta-xylanase [Lachnospiraceae bacterium]|nr:endo-1,4-beta-xylanase [Lachnospiraceae bacterium]